jgi:hypothetical protein
MGVAKKNNLKMRLTGIILIILSVLMGIFGIVLFSYRGGVTPKISKIGEYSFILWLSTLIAGIIITSVTKKNI